MKQITIYDLLPLLRNGWVAMDKNGYWGWCAAKPFLTHARWIVPPKVAFAPLSAMFNVARFDGDWKDSLMSVGAKIMKGGK